MKIFCTSRDEGIDKLAVFSLTDIASFSIKISSLYKLCITIPGRWTFSVSNSIFFFSFQTSIHSLWRQKRWKMIMPQIRSYAKFFQLPVTIPLQNILFENQEEIHEKINSSWRFLGTLVCQALSTLLNHHVIICHTHQNCANNTVISMTKYDILSRSLI